VIDNIATEDALPLTSMVGNQLHSLSTLAMPEFWKLWDKHFKERPKHPHRKQLESRLAYRLQEIADGGLSPKTRNLLEDIGERLSKIKTSKRLTTTLLPGTVLIREFDGIDYRVTVAIDGRFEFDGHKFKSLSAIAKQITGTQWSGPVFFGLKQGNSK
jgi:hypothetical protein